MVGFTLSCFALLLFLWLSFGGSIPLSPKGYRLRAAFPEATQLAEQADVRIAGVSVGKVIKKELDPKGNRTMAFIELKPEFAPLHKDAKATLRQKTLLGETYVELSPGSKDKPALHDGGLLDRNRVKRTVELDEIFEVLDPRTRQAYRTWTADLAASFKGRGQDLNDTIGNLPQFASTADDTLRVLDVEHAAVSGLVRDTGRVFGALSADPARLRSLVTSSERVFTQTAERNDDLAATIRVFPTFLDETRFTLARLERFAHNTDPLIRDLQPAVRDLVPTLRDLRRLAPHLHKLFVDLDPLITVSQTGLPAVRKTLHGARPVLGELGPFLGQLNPILQWLGLNQHLVADFITIGAGGVAAKTSSPSGGTGHYLRQFQPKGPEGFGFYNQRLETNRANPYLPPLGLALPQLFKQLKFPAWDCKNAPPAARKGPIEEGPNRQIGCFEAQTFMPNFHKQGTRFPHITANSYKAKK
jgi:phospholipid/cholesterol/gamma-HCH transport system substrate-binding protein